jgi:hypothetical protein
MPREVCPNQKFWQTSDVRLLFFTKNANFEFVSIAKGIQTLRSGSELSHWKARGRVVLEIFPLAEIV